jgi:IS5 family transposase
VKPKNTKPAARAAKHECRYRVRNWPEYNTALVHRGRLTLWIEASTLANWQSQVRTGRPGRPPVYSDVAIACALTLASVYRLPLRAAQGLLASLLCLLAPDLPVPHYSTLCRRRAGLKVGLNRSGTSGVHLVVDSTGLKVLGEGEWKVRQHGSDKRRTWRKLHLGIDESTFQIKAAEMTTSEVADGERLPALLNQVEDEIGQVAADGSYDWRSCYAAIAARGARAVIPPRKGAVIWQHGNCKAEPLDRDENLRAIRKLGRAKWKQQSGYTRRSLAETCMFRLKTIFGDRLSARRLAAHTGEALLRCVALNRMTDLGMPSSHAVIVT